MIGNHPTPENNTRIGMHYFPDTLHYRECDLTTWLPELEAMGVQWLTLLAPDNRAIPENFLRMIISHQIEPILHLHMPLPITPSIQDLSLLFDVYASWGVRYIALFDRPNTQQAWTKGSWVQQQLVDRFLDKFIPIAEMVCQREMFPILSPLEPGGNFWDTAFLRSALNHIEKRGHQRLISRLVIGAYAWPGNHSLEWGLGGPESWPDTRPYFTPDNSQDHLGFRIFDWYSYICKSTLGKDIPIMLLGTGFQLGDHQDDEHPPIDATQHAIKNLEIAKLLANHPESTTEHAPIPDHVLAGNFWLLSTSLDHPNYPQSWFPADSSPLPIVSHLKEWQREQQKGPVHSPDSDLETTQVKTIKDYLLLPQIDQEAINSYLEISQPYIINNLPTIGFSIEEAVDSVQVTLVGDDTLYPADTSRKLIRAGCRVIWISRNGTNVATNIETDPERQS